MTSLVTAAPPAYPPMQSHHTPWSSAVIPDLPEPPFPASVIPLTSSTVPAPGAGYRDWTQVQIRPGDTLSRVLADLGLPATAWRGIASAGDGAERIVALQPGDRLRVGHRADGRLGVLIHQADDAPTIKVIHAGGQFRIQVLTGPITQHRTFASGDIGVSLPAAAAREQIPAAIAATLADLLGPESDPRHNARFTVIYETTWRDGERIDAGPIIAAELTGSGDARQAFRYTTPDGISGYFNADGRRLGLALLRAPVDYNSITSPFDYNRMHPILGVVRPHLGVDYAAPSGTPVHAAGDGVVAFVGRKNGFGKVIVIRHNERLRTLYAHLHDFAAGLAVGARVSQNDLIGYVGETGLSTGPHLHYGVRVGDRFHDPRTLSLPRMQALAGTALEDYLGTIRPLVAALESQGELPTLAGR